jgi:hypothetical protein
MYQVEVGGQRGTETGFIPGTAGLHLPGISGTASHPDMQKIGTSAFFFASTMLWKFKTNLYGLFVQKFQNCSL